METTLKKDQEFFENSSPELTPSSELIEKAATLVSCRYLRHGPQERRENFREYLIKSTTEVDIPERIVILAGLRRAGLEYRKLKTGVSLFVRGPNLPNPNPDEFSTELMVAMDNPEEALDLIKIKGRENIEESKGQPGIIDWLENMELAARNKN